MWGEKRVGFYALRDIELDEEVTFDYKWSRTGTVRMPYDPTFFPLCWLLADNAAYCICYCFI